MIGKENFKFTRKHPSNLLIGEMTNFCYKGKRFLVTRTIFGVQIKRKKYESRIFTNFYHIPESEYNLLLQGV